MTTESHIEPVANAWRVASAKLGFEFESPYVLTIGHHRHSVIGFLPHFGSPSGMVLDTWIPSHTDHTHSLQEAARRAEMFCSCMNAETYDRYNEEKFIEALNDWGYFGPENLRPRWARRGDTLSSEPDG